MTDFVLGDPPLTRSCVTSDCMMGFRWWRVGLSLINQNRLCLVLIDEVKLNTIKCFQSLAKQNSQWKIEGKGPKTCLAFGTVFIKITIAFSVYKQILVFVFYENLNVYSRACVFVYVSCQKMPGMRQSTDLILPFTSVCLHKSAGEQEMHTPNKHHILNLHGEICLTSKYFMKYWLSRRKMTFWFTLSTACRSFQPNRFLQLWCSRTCSLAKLAAAGAWGRNTFTWCQTTPVNKARVVTLNLFC